MTSDLDLPLLPSAEQIRRREFATVRRGYDPDQVRDYLGQVAVQVETLEKDLRETKLRAESKAAMSPGEQLATKVAEEDSARAAQPPAPPNVLPAAPAPTEDAYERLSARFAAMIETADREATKIIDEAKAEAHRVLTEARAEADRIRVDAQARAEEARQRGSEELAKAKEEADRTLGSLATRREALMTQMHDMQTKLLAVAHDLDVSMSERDRSDQAPSPTGPAAGPQATAPAAEPEGAPAAQTADAPAGGSAAKPETEAKAKDERRGFDDDLVDPRYEDLWASSDTGTVDIPDLASIDVDFDEEPRKD